METNTQNGHSPQNLGALSEPGKFNKKKAPYMRNNWNGSKIIQELRKANAERYDGKTFSIIPEGWEK